MGPSTSGNGASKGLGVSARWTRLRFAAVEQGRKLRLACKRRGTGADSGSGSKPGDFDDRDSHLQRWFGVPVRREPLGRCRQLCVHKIWVHAASTDKEGRWSGAQEEKDEEEDDGRAPSMIAAAPALRPAVVSRGSDARQKKASCGNWHRYWHGQRW